MSIPSAFTAIEFVAASVPGALLLLVVAAVLVVEAGLLVGLLVPGSTVVLALGALAGTGAISTGWAVTVAAAATTVGCQWSFLSARKHGREHALPQFLTRFAGASALSTAGSLSRTRLHALSFAAPLIGGLRTIAPRVLANSSLPYWRFAALTSAAAVSWAGLLVSLGILAGSDERVSTAISAVGLPVIVLFLIGRAWATRRRQPTTGVASDRASRAARREGRTRQPASPNR
jgi:membrane-associated protein